MCEVSSSLTCGKGPSSRFTGFVSLRAPNGRFLGEGLTSTNAPIQALLCKSR